MACVRFSTGTGTRLEKVVKSDPIFKRRAGANPRPRRPSCLILSLVFTLIKPRVQSARSSREPSQGWGEGEGWRWTLSLGLDRSSPGGITVQLPRAKINGVVQSNLGAVAGSSRSGSRWQFTGIGKDSHSFLSVFRSQRFCGISREYWLF